MLNFRNYSELIRDTLKLAPALADVDAIVGVPRSGMIPATVLAQALNKPLAMAGHLIARSGNRVDVPIDVNNKGRWALVDDSVYTGRSMTQWTYDSEWCVRACVYMDPAVDPSLVHFAAVELPRPRIFQWNLWNCDMLRNCLIDIDGVLCPDPPMPEDAGEPYVKYIESAPVLHRPAVPVAAIVTNRLERHREATERWLAAAGVEYGQLLMAPFDTPGARRRLSTPADLKSAWYDAWVRDTSHPLGVLIESHDRIASQVSANVGAPVISTQSWSCFQP